MNFEKSALQNLKDRLYLEYEPFLVYGNAIQVKEVTRVRGNPARVKVTFDVDMYKRPVVREAVILKHGRHQRRTIELDREDLDSHPENPAFGLIWQKPASTPLNVANLLLFVNGFLETRILSSDLETIDMTKNPIVLRIKEESLFYFGTVNVNLL